MDGKEKFERFLKRYPHSRKPFFDRPHASRREFLQLCGGVTASCLALPLSGGDILSQAAVNTQNKAKYCIFVLLAGAPSHTDTFDFKMVNGVTPASFSPATINGLQWPTGLMPKLALQIPDLAIVRSMRSWALVHTLAQTWTQIGRNPAAVLGDVAPNIGSVVAIEKEPERQPGQVFPTFLALNSNGAIGNGYFSAAYAPLKIIPSTAGIANTVNANGQTRFTEQYAQLHAMDDSLRVNSPYGHPLEDMNNFYSSARGLMYNSTVQQAFSYTAADSARYGSNGFGNACLLAKQVLAAKQGTRFVQITLGGWDMHTTIYGTGDATDRGTNLNPLSPNCLARTLDNGVSTLIADLQASGLWNDTLLVMVGEFGRTVGALSGAQGRDHFLQQSAVFAGAGIRGGRAIGSTVANGSTTLDAGWSRMREVKPEDIEATIYSALGIDWTTVRRDDPLGRGFEYVPFSDQDIYGPINELWM